MGSGGTRAQIDRALRPLQLQGEGNRHATSDGLLQSAPGTGVVRAQQLDLLAALPVTVVRSWSRLTRLQNVEHLRVGQRWIVDWLEALPEG